MTIDEYYLAFESILYGLIISRILVKWAEMFKNQGLNSYHWAYILLTINLFCLIIYMFWVNRQPQHYEHVSGPFMFLLHVVIPPSIFTFMTYQIFPDEFSGVIQKDYLIKYRKHIFIPWVIYLVYNVYILSGNLLYFTPITIGTMIIIIMAAFIIKFPKLILVNIFIIIHTVLLAYGYMRFYLF
jgi:hypothetical protein